MTSFRFGFDIPEKDREASRFLMRAHHALLRAYAWRKEERKIKQRDIAEKTGLDKATVSRILRGGGNPTLRTIAEIAWALDMKPELRFTPVEAAAGGNRLPPQPPRTGTEASEAPKIESLQWRMPPAAGRVATAA